MAQLKRMTKRSKLRRIAKRALPQRLHAYRAAKYAADCDAKRPREPRIVQRQKRLAAKEAAKARASEQRTALAALLGVSDAA